MSRRHYDQYFTPTSATLALMDHLQLPVHSIIYEPCNGKGAITKPLITAGHAVYTGDIDPLMKPDYVADARVEWPLTPGVPLDWVITNPPFNGAMEILNNISNNIKTYDTGIALLLRLSFLEPTREREDFLSNYPPDDLLVLPRMSFTEDGKTDSVTCGWMVWQPNHKLHVPSIKVYTKEQLRNLERIYQQETT